MGELELELNELRDGVIMKCDKCDLAYSTFQTYKNHIDQFHKKSLSCSECGLRFTLKNTLVKHKIDYHSLYPKKCEQCPKILMTAKDFFEHLQSHSKNFIGPMTEEQIEDMKHKMTSLKPFNTFAP